MDVQLQQRLYGYELGIDGVAAADREGPLRSPYLERLIRRHFPEDRGAEILDLGCGAGLLLATAARRGYRRLSGVDSSPGRIEIARARGVGAAVVGDLCQHVAGLPPASHDLIITFDVLEHFGGDALVRLVDAVHVALRPGGRWLIHVPNAASPFFGQVFHGDITHRTAFTVQSLGWLLSASGFSELRGYEDTPVVHGVRSLARWLGWQGLRNLLRVWTAIETGDSGRDAVFTRSLLAVAVK
jgi:SAM-dependent methyltransferase